MKERIYNIKNIFKNIRKGKKMYSYNWLTNNYYKGINITILYIMNECDLVEY